MAISIENTQLQEICPICRRKFQNPVVCCDETFRLNIYSNTVILEKETYLTCLKAHIFCKKCIETWEDKKIEKKCCYCKRSYKRWHFLDLGYFETDKLSEIFRVFWISRKYLVDLTNNDFTKEGFSRLTKEKQIKVVTILLKTKSYDLIKEIVNDEFKNFYTGNVLRFWRKIPGGFEYLQEFLQDKTDFEKTFLLKDWINNNLQIKNLSRLDLSESNLAFLPEEIDLFTNLRILYLVDNHLEFLFDNFGENLSRLEELCLHNNYLEKLPKNFIQNSKKLKLLCLHNNKLKELPKNFIQNQKKLEILFLSMNELEFLPESFAQNLPNLQDLRLEMNHLKKLPENFVLYSKKLNVIYLFKNHLKSLPKNFGQNLKSLERLFLNDNELESLPLNFAQNLSNLQELALNNNQLKQLPEKFNLPNLIILTIQHNNIKNFFENFFRNLPSLQKFSIHRSLLPKSRFLFTKEGLKKELKVLICD